MRDRSRTLERTTRMLAWGIALTALWGAAHINVHYLEKIPHVQDSVNYLFQAQLFDMGKITIEAPPLVNSFASEHIIVQNNRWYCHYPFLVPLLFMIGMQFGATHLVNPIFAMLSVLLVYKIGKDNYSPWAGLWAAVFLASSPFFMVMSASFMSHPTGLLLTTVAIFLFLKILKTQNLRDSILLGLTIGLLFNTRPLTAFAISLPIFSFYLRNRGKFRKRLIRHLAVWILCTMIGVGGFFAYSSMLSGKALQFATHTRVSDTQGPSK
ncbi:MAG TPA: glycosyltransferase family 39 protein, partial [bacterium]|nr:glycosyltransferase family 39 protein [bacterium]